VATTEGGIVNQVFDRLNRNARKLTRQELRHARFEGAFCTHVESEADSPFWVDVGISTTARVRRMRDVEFIADLFILVMHGIVSSDPDRLDDYFAEYDDEIPNFKANAKRFEWVKKQIAELDGELAIAKSRYSNFADFYSVFAAILETSPKGINATKTAKALAAFAGRVEDPDTKDDHAAAYARAVRGASNDAKERKDRVDALRKIIVEAK